MSKELLEKHGFKQDIIDDAPNGVKYETPFPKPEQRFHLIYEDFNASIEESYFWVLNMVQRGFNYQRVEKITDTFSASEQSSFWAASQQRMSLQQQNASQYMRGIADMLKGLFQLVRELRDLDLRLKYYIDIKEKAPDWQTSEITLKGLWVDLVEGGSKSPASVYGMAQQLGFTILPDLFFRTSIQDTKKVGEIVDGLEFNPKVKEVLKRKLRQYLEWREISFKELSARRLWSLKYLRQHYNTIRLYAQWVKPYLRNAQKLAMKDQGKNPYMIGTFETSISEIELIGVLPKGKANVVMSMHFTYRTKPQMDFNKDGYQHRGPLHVGEIDMYLRGYIWTDEELESFLKMREEEDMALIADYDKSIADSLDALGDDLKDYLKEAGETFKEDEKPKVVKKRTWGEKLPVLQPFLSIGDGLKELFTFGMNDPKPKHDHVEEPKQVTEQEKWGIARAKKKARKDMETTLWLTYKFYKKAHAMITWS